MIALRTLEELGIDRTFFGLPAADAGAKCTFYSFEAERQRKVPLPLDGPWELIGICQHEPVPGELDVILLHIDEEAREYQWSSPEGLRHFEALRDAPGYVGLNADSFDALVAFFDELALRMTGISESAFAHFSRLTLADLLDLGFSPLVTPVLIEAGAQFYRFRPDERAASDVLAEISIVHLSGWSAHSRPAARATLSFIYDVWPAGTTRSCLRPYYD